MIFFGDRPGAAAAVACAAALAVLLVPHTAVGGDRYALELTAAYTGVSYTDDAAWGWWNPSKYDLWQTTDEDVFEIAEARLILAGDTYTFFLGFEQFPTLEAVAELSDDAGGEPLQLQLDTGIQVYDLAYGQDFQISQGFRLSPWLGVCYMDIDESRSLAEDSTGSGKDSAESGLWGVVAGAEGSVRLSNYWRMTGRVVVRWARGDRTTTIRLDDGDGGPQVDDAELEDSVDRTMYGAELAVRWVAADFLFVDGGWRYRDWTLNDGPANFNGPFLRMIVSF